MRKFVYTMAACASTVCGMAYADGQDGRGQAKPGNVASDSVPPIFPADSVIHWQTDLKAAQEQSRATGKPLLVLFTASQYCMPCRKFEQQVNSNPADASMFEGRCIPVYLELEARSTFSEAYRNQVTDTARKLENPSMPTFYVTDSELRPFVRCLGFGGRTEFLQWVDPALTLANDQLAMLQGRPLEEIADPQLLDRFLGSVAPDQLCLSWKDPVQQIIAKSQGVAPEIHEKWIKVQSVIQAEQVEKDVEAFTSKAYAQGKNQEEVVALIDQEVLKHEGNPRLQCMLRYQQADLLLRLEKLDAADAVLQVVTDRPDLLPQYQKQATDLMALAAIKSGDLSRAQSRMEKYYASQSFPNEELRTAAIELGMAKCLVSLGREEEALPRLRRAAANCDPAKDIGLSSLVVKCCSQLGTGDDLLGAVMFSVAQGLDGEHAAEKINCCLIAAVCFKAIGDEANAQKALDYFDSLPPPDAYNQRKISVKREAAATRVEALKFKVNRTNGPANARYLMQAAFAAKSAGQESEAKDFAARAETVLSTSSGHGNKSARQAAEELLSQWKMAQPQ